MSLLEIVQDASDIIGLPEVTSVIGNNDKNVRQMLAAIRSGGNTIARKTNSNGGSWSVLERQAEFVTQDATTEYDLAADFSRLTTDTAWQKDRYWKLRGSATPRQWQAIKNRQATIPYNVYRILRTAGAIGTVGNDAAPNTIRKFTLEPAAGAGITIVYEYISRDWWVSANGQTFRRRPTADDDESVFGNDLHVLDAIWRWKSANGFNFAADLAVFELELDRMMVQDENAEYVSVGHDRRFGANKDESDVEWCW